MLLRDMLAVPTPEVIATPVGSTGAASPHPPDPQPCLPQPVKADIKKPRPKKSQTYHTNFYQDWTVYLSG